MSPEQIDAQPIGPQSDLYSLGLIAYELLTGAPPFSSESPREILNQQCTVPPPAFSQEVLVGLPHGLVHLIFALLHKKPEDRPASARVVRRELAPFMTGAAAPDVAPTRRESSSVPKDALDTIAIVERVSSRASIPNRTAAIALAIIAISVAAATYIVRVITYDPPAHGEVAHATR
jgi:serine/threonine-protein kinase